MKKQSLIFIIGIFILASIVLSGRQIEKYWKDCYQAGKLILNEKLRIDSSSLPEDEVLRDISRFTETKKGFVFISDAWLHKIFIFDASGKFVKSVGRKGNGPGDLYLPGELGCINHDVFVWESGNQRFSLFSESGEFLNFFKIKNRLFINKVRVSSNNNIIMGTVNYRFGTGKDQESVIGLYSRDFEFVKVLFSHSFCQFKHILKPEEATLPIPFAPLVSWDLAPNGNVIVGFQRKYEIEIHDPARGKISSFSHQYTPIEVTNEDKEEFFASIISGDANSISRGADEFTRKHTAFPKFKPAFKDIVVDSDNNILVFPYPDSKNKKKIYFDAFDAGGHFINRVELIVETSPVIDFSKTRFNKDYLWVVVTDEDGERSLVKFIKGSGN